MHLLLIMIIIIIIVIVIIIIIIIIFSSSNTVAYMLLKRVTAYSRELAHRIWSNTVKAIQHIASIY